MKTASAHAEFETQAALSELPATVHIVDEDISIRQSLASYVQLAGWRVETFASAQSFLTAPRAVAPGCLVASASQLSLDDCDHRDAMAQGAFDLPTIFIGRSDVPTAVRAIKAGGFDFLAKPINLGALLQAIDRAVEISCAMLDERLDAQALRTKYASLSERERQVMLLVARGRLNKQVGGDLGISEITVKAHRGQAMRKMGARTFAELVNMAAKLDPARAPMRRNGRRASGLYDGVATTIVL